MKLKTFFSELQFGQNTNSYFRNFQYSPADPTELQFGELFMTIEIIGNSGAEGVTSEMWGKLQESYYSHVGEDSYTSFESAIRDVNDSLHEMLERSQQETLGQINAIVAVRTLNQLYIAQTGIAEAYLFRAGKLVRVSEGIADPTSAPINNFQNISSGEISDKDQLIFSSSHLLQLITQDQIEHIFNRDRGMSFIADLQEKIVPDAGQAIGLTFIAISRDEEPENKSPVSRIDKSNRFSVPSGTFSKIISGIKEHGPHLGRHLRNFRLKIADWADEVRYNTDRRTASFALIVMAVVLIVSVIVIYSKNSEQQSIEEFQIAFSELKDQVAKAERLLIYDPEGATKFLLGADQEADRLLQKGLFPTNVEATKKQIRDDLDKVQGIERITLSTGEIADLATANKDADPIGLIRIENSMHAYDSKNWYSVTLDKVSLQEINPDIEIKTGTYFDDQEVTVLLTKDDRLIEWNGNQAQIMRTEDETFHPAVAIGQYSRYLYFLDPESNQIWKYARGTDDYSRASEYNQDTNLNQASDIAIDGDIYITTLDSNIKQIFRGKQTDWFPETPAGVELDKPIRVRTSLAGKSIYVQDRNDRIMQFIKKDGIYFRQFVFDLGDEEEIADFLIDDENMKIFVLVGSKIYMVSMLPK